MTSYLPGVRTLSNVRVPMRDGVTLATDIYLPEDATGPLPVLLERIPYDKRGTNQGDRTLIDPVPHAKPEIAAEFVRAGYVYVLQDCRGRYASEGDFTKYLNEDRDGVDTIEWIREQDWSSGLVGTLGLSYGAHVQTALASHGPEGLAAMFLDSGGFSSAFHSGIRQGGAFELKQLTWAVKHALLAPETTRDPARRAALLAQDIREWVRIAPWLAGRSPLGAAPEYESYIAEQWAHELFDDYWKRPGIYARGYYDRFPDIPMVHMSSWYDPYSVTAVDNYLGLSRIKQAPVKLVLGPWTHGQRSVTHSGDVDFGPQAPLDGNLATDYIALRRGWFDQHLRGMDVAPILPDPVTLFVMGGGSGRRTSAGKLDHGGHWRGASDWPLPEAINTAFFLHGDHSLTTAAPTASEAISFRFDPTDPVPTIGGAFASGAPLMRAGAFDQREASDIFGAKVLGRALADRDDVVIFETAPLENDVEVIGDIVAHLWVSSSALDTDFTIKLVDVHPANEDYPLGYAMNLTHGLLRLRFRNSFELSELMEPHEIYAIEVRAFPTANRFLAGHRIRVEISSSNFPHFDVNPNSGAPAGEVSDPVVAINSVHMAPDRPSHILLPIIPGG